MIKVVLKQISPRVKIMLINQLVTLFTIPWIANHMNIETFGFIATALIIIQSGWIIADWGGMNYATEIWHPRKSNIIKNNIVTNLVCSKLFIVIIYLIIINLLIFFKIIVLPFAFFIALIPATIFGSIFPLWFYHVNKIPNEMLKITFVTRFLFLFLVFFFVKSDQDAYLYLHLFSIAISTITIYAICQMSIKHSIRWRGFDFISSYNHIHKGYNFFINSLTNNHIQTIWSLSFALTASPIMIGLYNIAEQGYRAGNALSNTVSQVLRLNTRDKPIVKSKQTVIVFSAIFSISALICYFCSEYVVRTIFSYKFYEVIPILKLMIVVWLIQSLIHLINYPLLGKLIGVKKIHFLNPYFIFLHAIGLLFWQISNGSLINMMYFFISISLLQLTIMLIFIVRNNKS